MAQILIGVAVSAALNLALKALFPPAPVDGPRMTTLKPPASDYGRGIARVWATAAVDGNCIWARDIVEVKTTQAAPGAKGGPTENVYTYYGYAAYELCEGPVDAIVKLWLNNKLVLDYAGDGLKNFNSSDPQAWAASFGQTHKHGWGNLRLYYGTEDQLPDPTIQSFKGVGRTPAYRGKSYIVLNYYPLKDLGNMLPTSVRAVVIKRDSTFYPHAEFETGYSNVSDLVFDPNPQRPYLHFTTASPGKIVSFNRLTGNVDKVITVNAGDQVNTLAVSYADAIMAVNESAASTTVKLVNWSTGQVTETFIPDGFSVRTKCCFVDMPLTGTAITPAGASGAPDPATVQPLLYTGGLLGTNGMMALTKAGVRDAIMGNAFAGSADGGMASFDPVRNRALFLTTPYIASANGGTISVVSLAENNTGGGALTRQFSVTSYDQSAFGAVNGTGGGTEDGRMIVYDYATDRYIYVTDKGIFKIDPDTMTTESHFVLPGGTDGNLNDTTIKGQSWLDGTLFVYGNANAILFFDTATMTIEQQYDVTSWGLGHVAGLIWDPAAGGMWGWSGSKIVLLFLERMTSTTIPLSEIVSDLCAEVGLGSSDIDVSELMGIPVRGMVRDKPTSQRTMIEYLQQAFRFDVVEEDFKLKFKTRDRDTVLSVAAGELARDAGGTRGGQGGGQGGGINQADGNRLTESKLQETDLPRRVWVKYFDPARSFEVGTQPSQRIQAATEVVNETTLDLPIVMDDQQAKDAAEIVLAETWMARSTFDFHLPPKYMHLRPCDVIEVEKLSRAGSKYQKLRLVEWETGANLASRAKGVWVREGAYAKKARAGVPSTSDNSPDGGNEIIPFAAPTKGFFIDLPVLDPNTDDNGGMWAGAGPTVGGANVRWPGASIFRSTDGVAGYVSLASENTPTDWGVLQTALAAYGKYTHFDDVNSLVAVFPSGYVPVSKTDQEVLAGSNMLLVGDEIMQFATASSSGGVWTLTHLLRGRYSTEGYMSHAAGEAIVAVDASKMDRISEVSELGANRWYKAVPIGAEVNAAPTTIKANRCWGLKPWSVCDVAGSRDGSNNLTVTWRRRARYANGIFDGQEIPLLEATESYQVDLYGWDSTVAHTYSATSPSLTISHADLVTYLSPPAGNLLANPSFETGNNAGWNNYGAAGHADTGRAHAGSWAWKVNGLFNSFYMYQDIPLPAVAAALIAAGASLNSVFAGWQFSNASSDYYIIYLNGSGAEISRDSLTWAGTGGAWTNWTLTGGNIPAGTATLRIWTQCNSGFGDFYWDDYSFSLGSLSGAILATVDIYQISATAGRGHKRSAAL